MGPHRCLVWHFIPPRPYLLAAPATSGTPTEKSVTPGTAASLSEQDRRESRVRNGAAQEIKRLLERAVILFIRRHIGLRARFLAALGLEVAAERRLALGVGARFQLVRHFLEDLDIGRDALGLD